MARLILFDIDGTLIRTGGAGMKAFAQAFAQEFGVQDGSEKLKFAGRTDYSLVREFFVHNRVEPSAQNFDRFFKAYIAFLEEQIQQCEGEVLPGISHLMNELRKLPEPPVFGLLTGNVRRGAEIKLQRFNLWHEFQFGGFADDHEERDCIAAIAKQRGAAYLPHPLSDHEVIVIGDTPLDIRCARAINARVIAVATGGHTLDELKSFNPDWVLADLTCISANEICRRS